MRKPCTGCPRKNAPLSGNTKGLYEIIYYKSKYIEAGRLTQSAVFTKVISLTLFFYCNLF